MREAKLRVKIVLNLYFWREASIFDLLNFFDQLIGQFPRKG